MVTVYHSEKTQTEREEAHGAAPRSVPGVVFPSVLSLGSHGPHHLLPTISVENRQPGKPTRASVSEPVRGLGHVAMVDL